jgi:hypothetical protein
MFCSSSSEYRCEEKKGGRVEGSDEEDLGMFGESAVTCRALSGFHFRQRGGTRFLLPLIVIQRRLRVFGPLRDKCIIAVFWALHLRKLDMLLAMEE